MRFHTTVAVALSATSAVVAQGLGGLPKCAQTCVGNSLSNSGCKTVDIACICRNKGYISGLACCVSGVCSPEDTQATVEFANNICKGAGVTDLPQSATCEGSSSTSAAPASTAYVFPPSHPSLPARPHHTTVEGTFPGFGFNFQHLASDASLSAAAAFASGDFDPVPLVSLPGTVYTPPPLASGIISAPPSGSSVAPPNGSIVTDTNAPASTITNTRPSSRPASSSEMAPAAAASTESAASGMSGMSSMAGSMASSTASGASASGSSPATSATSGASESAAAATSDAAAAATSTATPPSAAPAGRLQVQGLLTGVFSALGLGLGVVAFFL